MKKDGSVGRLRYKSVESILNVYSGASRHLIPFESATQFRFIPPPDSGGFRHGNPGQSATSLRSISEAG